MPHDLCLLGSPKNERARRCAICWDEGPLERHHVASKRQCGWLVISVCRACHRDLSDRQYRWAMNWHSESRPLYCIAQGVADCLAVWRDRSTGGVLADDLLLPLLSAARAVTGCCIWARCWQ